MNTPPPDQASSKVQLTLMSLYRRTTSASIDQVTPFVGTQQAWLQQGQVQLMANSVPFHDRSMDALAPKAGQGMLALFGIRDALAELQHWRTVARNSQAHFAYLQLQVDIGVAHTGVITRELLQSQQQALRFLNAKRCAADLQKQWLAQFAQWVQEEGGDAAAQMQHVRQMAARPDLFERLLWTDPDLRWIDVMVLPLADWPGSTRTRQVAYVRAGAAIAQRLQGSDQVSVQLPQWMDQRPQ